MKEEVPDTQLIPPSGTCCVPGGSTPSEFSRRPRGGKRQHFSDCHPLLPRLQVIWRNSGAAITLSHFCLPGGVTWFGAAPGLLMDESWAPSISIQSGPSPPPAAQAPAHRGSHGLVRSWALWPGQEAPFAAGICVPGPGRLREECQARVGLGFCVGKGPGLWRLVGAGKFPASDQTA